MTTSPALMVIGCPDRLSTVSAALRRVSFHRRCPSVSPGVVLVRTQRANAGSSKREVQAEQDVHKTYLCEATP